MEEIINKRDKAKKFVKPAIVIIEMAPCNFLAVSQDNSTTPPSGLTGGVSPGGTVPPMGWAGE